MKPQVDTSQKLPTKKRKFGDAVGPSTTSSDSVSAKSQPLPCFYCDEKTAKTHPYVPFNSAGRPIPFCVACEKNWNQHRESVKQKNKLHVDGDFNEEICALCSNWPKKLICCSYCPRSYCKSCLKLTLTRSELKKAHEPGDWSCMHCTHQRTTTAKATSPTISNAAARKKSADMSVKREAACISDEINMNQAFIENGHKGAGQVINWLQCIIALYGRLRDVDSRGSGSLV